MRKIHRHMVDGITVVYTDGSAWDCPPERECWVELSDEQAAWTLVENLGAPSSSKEAAK